MPQLDAFGWAEPRVAGLGRFCPRTQPSPAVHSPSAGRPGAIRGAGAGAGYSGRARRPAGEPPYAGATAIQ